jgi:hypothetical protein
MVSFTVFNRYPRSGAPSSEWKIADSDSESGWYHRDSLCGLRQPQASLQVNKHVDVHCYSLHTCLAPFSVHAFVCVFSFITNKLLHVHTLLGNRLVNKFPPRQILGKQSGATLCNRRSVFSGVRAVPSAKQQNCKHVYNNRCFLWGRCRSFIGDSEGRLQPVIAEKLCVKDTKPSRKALWGFSCEVLTDIEVFMCYSSWECKKLQ